MRIDGAAAVITGGSRGIGKAITLALAGHGANVLINYVTKCEDAEAVAEEVRAMGVDAIACQADVSLYEDAERMIDTAKREFGQLDILVNNAGTIRDRTIRKMTRDDWDKVIAVNLTGAFYCTKHAVRYMSEQGGGKIIMIGSIIGRGGGFGQSNYAASKAGLIGFARSIAYELARHNIQVNVVAPGFVETDMLMSVPEGVRNSIKCQIPLGRFGKPEEIANAVVFLIKNDFITGGVLYIDGGQFAPTHLIR